MLSLNKQNYYRNDIFEYFNKAQIDISDIHIYKEKFSCIQDTFTLELFSEPSTSQYLN